jgi:hypothetical protein
MLCCVDRLLRLGRSGGLFLGRARNLFGAALGLARGAVRLDRGLQYILHARCQRRKIGAARSSSATTLRPDCASDVAVSAAP